MKGGTAAAQRPSWLPAVNWYFDEVLQRTAGQGFLPNYCDPTCVSQRLERTKAPQHHPPESARMHLLEHIACEGGA